jgi:hypothetical protein
MGDSSQEPKIISQCSYSYFPKGSNKVLIRVTLEIDCTLLRLFCFLFIMDLCVDSFYPRKFYMES